MIYINNLFLFFLSFFLSVVYPGVFLYFPFSRNCFQTYYLHEMVFFKIACNEKRKKGQKNMTRKKKGINGSKSQENIGSIKPM